MIHPLLRFIAMAIISDIFCRVLGVVVRLFFLTILPHRNVVLWQIHNLMIFRKLVDGHVVHPIGLLLCYDSPMEVEIVTAISENIPARMTQHPSRAAVIRTRRPCLICIALFFDAVAWAPAAFFGFFRADVATVSVSR